MRQEDSSPKIPELEIRSNSKYGVRGKRKREKERAGRYFYVNYDHPLNWKCRIETGNVS